MPDVLAHDDGVSPGGHHVAGVDRVVLVWGQDDRRVGVSRVGDGIARVDRDTVHRGDWVGGTDHRECTAPAVTRPTASSTATVSVGSSIWQPALMHAASQAASAALTLRSLGSAMHGRRRGDPLGAGVDVHGGAAEEADEGDAGFLGEIDGE